MFDLKYPVQDAGLLFSKNLVYAVHPDTNLVSAFSLDTHKIVKQILVESAPTMVRIADSWRH